MSILIRGMEMPKAVFGSMVVAIRPNGMVVDVMGRYVGKAVPVPPHGRLIDADALPWENQGLMLTDPDEWGLKAWDIEHAPTIIPASGGAE